MNGVAAKITQKVGVLFQHRHIHASASEEIASHDAGGTSTNDTALDFNGISHEGVLLRRG